EEMTATLRRRVVVAQLPGLEQDRQRRGLCERAEGHSDRGQNDHPRDDVESPVPRRGRAVGVRGPEADDQLRRPCKRSAEQPVPLQQLGMQPSHNDGDNWTMVTAIASTLTACQ